MRQNIIIQAPINTYSGYGARSRDFIRQFINIYKQSYNIMIIPTGWGNTPNGFINDNMDQWGWLSDYIINQNIYKTINKDILLLFSIPSQAPVNSEFKKVICITAGIQTNAYPYQWIQGINRCNAVIFSSTHGLTTALSTKFQIPQKENEYRGVLQNIPLRVIFQGSNTHIYNSQYVMYNRQLNDALNSIKQDFIYLVTGNWIPTGIGQDRKDIHGTIKMFIDTFKNKQNKPALLIKTNFINNSCVDKNKVLKAIAELIGENPQVNIYLLHGQFSDQQMSQLYNHPKVKSMISLTHGQGYGRPLQQFALTGKPIIVSDWSGQKDFIQLPHLLVKGELKPVTHNNQFFIQGSSWFVVDQGYTQMKFKQCHKSYDDILQKTKKYGKHLQQKVSLQSMNKKIKQIFNQILTKGK